MGQFVVKDEINRVFCGLRFFFFLVRDGIPACLKPNNRYCVCSPKWSKSIPVFRPNNSKTIPFGRDIPHTYIGTMGGGGGGGAWKLTEKQ